MKPATDRKLAFTASVPLGLEPLAKLSAGLPAYFEAMAAATNELLAVSALAALMELGRVPASLHDDLKGRARHRAIASRAFHYFLNHFDYAAAKEVIELSPAGGNLSSEYMAAELSLDLLRQAELEEQLFLDDGNVEHLRRAAHLINGAKGWRDAVPKFVTAFLAQPADPRGCFELLKTLIDANQNETVLRVCEFFRSRNLFVQEALLFGAYAEVALGRPKDAVRLLEQIRTKDSTAKVKMHAANCRALAHERLGEFRDAYANFARQHTAAETSHDPAAFLQGVSRRASYTVEAMPLDERAEQHLMLVGFPRSGTTLLENALAAHSRIQTFEEIPAFTSLARAVEAGVINRRLSAEGGLFARSRYYQEIDRRVSKPGRTRTIEKMPLSSAEGPLLAQIFPQMRYLFALRHPCDVVLSCFRQLFHPNSAMANFRTVEQAVNLYDIAMSNWFSVHSMDDPQVHYVRYEDVVESFRPTLEGVLAFMGLSWEESVEEFASLADKRPATTPSYSMVRSGLKGVQSNWQNYRFAFRDKDMAKLARWMVLFGYQKD